MTFTVKIEKIYPEVEIFTFTNRQEAKDFFRAEQRKPTYNGGTAYDENHMTIFDDEFNWEMPDYIFQ